MQIGYDPSQIHQQIPVERVRAVADASIHWIPRKASGTLTFFSRQDEPAIDPVLALQAINTVRQASQDPELKPLERIERPAWQTGSLTVPDWVDLSIEMETGTGKTYVYLRTIFALAEAKGLSAFIIVVPSVAIREGVMKSISQTRAHFQALFGGRELNAFIYSSDRTGDVRRFGDLADRIDVMVVTLDSFNKDGNILRQQTEAGGGEPLIGRLAAARPVVILDEPQNMASAISQAAIEMLHPLLVLRYSATHREPLNLLYRLIAGPGTAPWPCQEH